MMRDNSELPQAGAAPPLLVVLSGPSASGKGSLVAALQQLDRPWHFAVTATTRPKRPDEVDGRDYIFKEVSEFMRMRERDELLECAEVYGRWYGVPRQQVRDPIIAGKDVILEIDVQGAGTIRELAPQALTIFVMPATMVSLRDRLAHRGTENPDDMERRLREAAVELERMEEFDYRVVNRDGELDVAVREIDAIISAEKCRVNPRLVQML